VATCVAKCGQCENTITDADDDDDDADNDDGLPEHRGPPQMQNNIRVFPRRVRLSNTCLWAAVDVVGIKAVFAGGRPSADLTVTTVCDSTRRQDDFTFTRPVTDHSASWHVDL